MIIGDWIRCGELVVQNDTAPSGDCPPDVYRFEFEDGEAQLCLRCAVNRTLAGERWMGAMGPLSEDGMCEDCGNDGRGTLCA